MIDKRILLGFGRRFLAGISAAGLLAGGIPGILYAEETDAGDGAAMGRYLESEVELPENDGTLDIRDIVRMEDGRLRLIGSSVETGMAMWDSGDGGDSWELAVSLPPEYGKVYFTDMALCADGGGAGIVMYQGQEWPENTEGNTGGAEKADSDEGTDTAEEAGATIGSSDDYTFHFVSFDAEGNAKHTPCTVSDMATLRFSRSGELLWLTPSGDAYVVDRETGEAVLTLGSKTNIIGICQNQALLLMKSELQQYDMTTGEPTSRDEVLEEMLYADGETYEMRTSSGHPITFAEDEEGRLYYCTPKGIFSHVMGGSVVEQIADGALNSLSDLNGAVVSMEIADQNFYVIYTRDMGTRGLLKYTYDPNISTVPEKELRVYSLQEDRGIRQMAVLFQKEHPDTFVNYQVGMSGADGVTGADALRTLNTEILAGNGPDILILDGMSVETYAEKGVLTDLSSILSEVQSEDGLLENIAYAYQADEAVPAVPVRFGIPMAVGKAELLGMLDGLDSLVELEKQEAFSLSNIVCFPNIIYPACAVSWTNEDGTMNAEGLAEFIRVMKQIYDGYQERLSGEELEWMNAHEATMKEIRQSQGVDISSIGFQFDNLLFPDMRKQIAGLCTGILLEIDDYSGISSVRRELEDCEMKIFDGQQSDTFIPVCTAGILKTAKEPERASDFLKYLLSKEGEVQNSGYGFPVNEQAFHSVLFDAKWGEGDGISTGWGSADGSEEYTLVYSWPTREELEWLETSAKQLTVCADTQGVQQQVVLEELNRCLDGEIGEEEAVNSILQSINLYLAE